MSALSQSTFAIVRIEDLETVSLLLCILLKRADVLSVR
jgi:hypothetical protein